eukprot:1470066-Prymnesium_polylepis.1
MPVHCALPYGTVVYSARDTHHASVKNTVPRPGPPPSRRRWAKTRPPAVYQHMCRSSPGVSQWQARLLHGGQRIKATRPTRPEGVRQCTRVVGT